MKILSSIIIFVFTATMVNAQTTDLFFSEYGEGSSNNKYLEIYNGTGAAVDLNNYAISNCGNGCSVVDVFDFPNTIVWDPGTMLAHGDVYVIAHPSADPLILAKADMTFTYLSNGDDGFALVQAGGDASTYTIIDMLGDLSTVDGTGWDVAGTSNGTVNHTIIRKMDVCSGNPLQVPAGSFGTDVDNSEWVVEASNYWDNLGYHVNTCSMAPCDTYSQNIISNCGDYTAPSGTIFTTSGNYTDTIQNTAMCDSIIYLDLTVNPSYFNVPAEVTICAGNDYVFGSQTLTMQGVYYETFQTASLCDSVVELTLSVVSSYTENISATICSNETYQLGTQTLSANGNYSELFQSTAGCDSTVNLDLTVLPTASNSITEIVCDSYTSPSGNYEWTQTGMYVDTVSAANGCDSIISIDLTVNASEIQYFTASACDSYDFEGNTYTNSGIYQLVYTNSANCDSIHELNLTITNTPAAPTTSGDQTLCNGDAAADITATSTLSDATLIISGVMDGPLSFSASKCIEFYAIEDIPDLSIYGFGSANNGGGTDGEEFTFPALSLNAGDYYRVATDSTGFMTWFGIYPENVSSVININGDDAIELFMNGSVIDVLGQIDVDGSGTSWDHLDGWAYRVSDALPNGGVWTDTDWTFSGINALDGESTNATAASPFPIGTFTSSNPVAIHTWYDDASLMLMLQVGDSYTTGQTAGTDGYYVTASINGCESLASTVTITFIDCSAGIEETESSVFNVYPNPTSGELNFTFEGEKTSISITDLKGKELFNKTVESGDSINVDFLSSGAYLINLTIDNQKITKRIIIE